MDTRARFRGLAGWVSFAALVVCGLGGAAARPGHVLVGVPEWSAAAAVVAVIAAVAWRLGIESGRPLIGLAIPLAVVGLLGPVPGVRALAGAPLLALAAAGGVALLIARGWAPPSRALLPIVLVVYAAIAWRVQTTVGPHGDEPHYLMVAESLLRDHDLELERDYAEARYRAFTSETLAPHYRVRGRGGAIYSVHAIGLSILVLPAYALAGYAGVSFFMAALAALLVRELRALLREAEVSAGLSEGVAWLIAFSPPLVQYVGLVFTEVPAALVIARALRYARRTDASPLATASWLAPLVILPWFNVRYAPVTLVLAVLAVSGRPSRRRVAALVGAGAVSAVAIGAYHFALYGFFDPRLVWGRRPEFAVGTLLEGLPGLALDQEFGLLPYAPVFALCAAGLVRLARGRTPRGWAGVALAAVVIGTAGSWHMWRGGFNPPARFLVPLVPVFALALAAALRQGAGASAALLAGWSLWVGALSVVDPSLVHRDRDGTAPFFRTWSGAEEWTRLLPGYVLEETAGDRTALAVVWATILAGAVGATVAGRRSEPTANGLAGATVALAAGAGIASLLSHATTGGRDAVRVLGRTAIAAPGWRVTREAAWAPSVLGWGPLYEPHRFPDGAELGSRLRLRPGAYRIEVDADSLGEAAPTLEVRPEGQATGRRQPLTHTPAGWSGSFEIGPADPAVSLRLAGGSPLSLHRIRISTFSADAGLSHREP